MFKGHRNKYERFSNGCLTLNKNDIDWIITQNKINIYDSILIQIDNK